MLNDFIFNLINVLVIQYQEFYTVKLMANIEVLMEEASLPNCNFKMSDIKI